MKLTIEEHVANVVAKAPPLTAEQRDRLAGLLKPRKPTLDQPDLTFLEEALKA